MHWHGVLGFCSFMERLTLNGGGRPRWMMIIMIAEPRTRTRERGSRCMAAVVQDRSASSIASPPPSRVSCSGFPITGNSQGARPVFRAKTTVQLLLPSFPRPLRERPSCAVLRSIPSLQRTKRWAGNGREAQVLKLMLAARAM